MQKFDLSALRKALEQLRIALEHAQKASNKGDMELYSLFRMSAIQAFEYSYELTLRMMKRYHEHFAPVREKMDDIIFRDFMRIAAESGIVREPMQWLAFRECRNSTSHTYDEKKAEEVMQVIPDFMAEAMRVLGALEERTLAS